MYKVYWKQAIQMLRQNKFISIISIVGTALAIMMIMTLIVVDEVKNISIAPENNRDRTLYITYEYRGYIPGGHSNGTVTLNTINEYLLHLQTPEYIAPLSHKSRRTVNVESSTVFSQFSARHTNADYWKIYMFDFIDGVPFSAEDVRSGIHDVVISESVASALFRGERAVGRTIQIDFKNFRVAGVVKDILPLFGRASSDIWIPFTTLGFDGSSEYLYRFGDVVLVAKDKKDFPAIIAEVQDVQRRFNIENEDWTLYLRVLSHGHSNANVGWANSDEEMQNAIKVANRRRILLFAFLLLIPALNLSGFSLSRIKKRTAEIGVRKAFGAKKHTILIQVLYENLITSLIGGVIGLMLSYAAVIWLKSWLLGIPDDSSIPINAFFSPVILIIVFFLCVIINLLSAGLTAFKASRMSIVNSLNKNDR
jgi:putative ABC transport system permease protein